MSRITKVKPMRANGTFGTEIPIGADAANVKLANGATLQQALGNVDTSHGSLAQQVTALDAATQPKLTPGTHITITSDNIIDADLDDYALTANVPTKVSQLQNDSQFITGEVTGLSNYYDKTQSYSKSEVNSLVAALNAMTMTVVEQLPTTDIPERTIFLIRKTDTGTNDIYDEFVYINNNWELLGTTQIDLSVKQDLLVSGTNIKTLSGESLLGSGDINLPIIKVQNSQPSAQSGRTIIWIDTSN